MVFDTSQNKTSFVAIDPDLHWKGGVLPDDEPENSYGRQRHTDGVEVVSGKAGSLVFSGLFSLSSPFVSVCACLPPGLNVQDVIMIVLSVSVAVVTAIALIFYR